MHLFSPELARFDKKLVVLLAKCLFALLHVCIVLLTTCRQFLTTKGLPFIAQGKFADELAGKV